MNKKMCEVSLKKIIGFPGYAVDIDKGRVYSYMKSVKKEMKPWKTLRGRLVIGLTKDGKRRNVSLLRVWCCAAYGLDYFKLPKDVRVLKGDDGRPYLGTIADVARKSVQSRVKAIARYRLQIINRKISELMLMRDYYTTGDRKPVLLYVEAIRKNMIIWYSRYYGVSMETSEFVFEAAAQAFVSRIEVADSQILDIMLYVKHLMVTEHSRLRHEHRCATKEEYNRIGL